MKTLAITFIFSLSVLFTHAKHALSELNLKLYDNTPFTLVLNNQVYGSPSNNFNLGSLTQGKHYLQVIKQNYNYYGYSTSQVIFNGYITVPKSTKVFAMIDFYNRFNIISQVPVFDGGNNGNGHGNGNGNGNGHQHGHGNNNLHHNHYNGTINENPFISVGIPSPTFLQLKFTINNSAFDNNKLQIAIQGISYGVSSQQVLELMGLLTFESNKLKLAKMAYAHTIDPQNYYLVNNGFTFSSSINALNHHLNQF